MKTQPTHGSQHASCHRPPSIPTEVFLVALIACLTAASRALAADVYGIQILSSEYDLWGNWTTYDYKYGTQLDTGSYSVSSRDGHPISAEVHANQATVHAGINTFWMRNWSYVGIEHLYTGAAASWQFRPLNPVLTVGLSGYLGYNYYSSEQHLAFMLTDLTSGQSLINIPKYTEWGGIDLLYHFNVDTTHTYDFTIGFEAGYFSFKEVNMTVSASFFARSAVPDSASTNALLLIPLAGLVLLRWLANGRTADIAA
jgi:hypothetical protein